MVEFNGQIYCTKLSLKQVHQHVQPNEREESSSLLHNPAAVTANHTYVEPNETMRQLKILFHHVSGTNVQNHANPDDYPILIKVQTEKKRSFRLQVL